MQPTNPLPQASFLIFSASLRKESFNTKLAKIAASIIEKNGGKVDFAYMDEFDCPSMNQDLEIDDFRPAGAEALKLRILANDAFIIASPEYNGAMPGLLKNTIDWVSRFRPQPFSKSRALLLSASPSMSGGNQGLWSLRVPLEKLGCNVYSSMFSLATANKAFTSEDTIADEALAKRLEGTLIDFMDAVQASKNYPTMKKAWIEFLGEQPDSAAENK